MSTLHGTNDQFQILGEILGVLVYMYFEANSDFLIAFQSEDEDQLVVPGHGLPKAHRDCRWVEGTLPFLFFHFSVLCDIQKHYSETPLSFQVRPFYEKRMGQEVEADTLGDEFKVITLNFNINVFLCPVHPLF